MGIPSLAPNGVRSRERRARPSRTKSGNAVLVRNPHLDWEAGYYEAQVTVPGIINFYGDFRVGYPLFYNGGFNENLGWATTNNYPDLDEIYALDVELVHNRRRLSLEEIIELKHSMHMLAADRLKDDLIIEAQLIRRYRPGMR
ncbi:MAG: penicillin acylase family protein [Gemmatimonadales bacterium]